MVKSLEGYGVMHASCFYESRAQTSLPCPRRTIERQEPAAIRQTCAVLWAPREICRVPRLSHRRRRRRAFLDHPVLPPTMKKKRRELLLHDVRTRQEKVSRNSEEHIFPILQHELKSCVDPSRIVVMVVVVVVVF